MASDRRQKDAAKAKFGGLRQMVRGKFQVVNITHNHWNKESRTIKLQAVYDNGIEENAKYAKATPSGSIEIQIDNPPAAEFFELGKYVYVDFSAVE
jgi:hypothetical protein